MKRMAYELGFTALIIISGIISISYVFGITSDISLSDSVISMIDTEAKDIDAEYSIDSIDSSLFKVDSIIIDKNTEFDYRDYISAKTHGGMDVSSYVTMEGDVDVSKSGEYPVRFCLRFNGQSIIRSSAVYVRGDLEMYTLTFTVSVGDEIEIYNEESELVKYMKAENSECVVNNLPSGRYAIRINDVKSEFEIIDCDLDLGEL